MRDSIHLLKYDKMHPAARVLGRMLAEAIGQLAGDAPSEMLVIPVPLHRRKNAQRGFNQAHLLARRALALANRSALLKRFFIGQALGQPPDLTAWESGRPSPRR